MEEFLGVQTSVAVSVVGEAVARGNIPPYLDCLVPGVKFQELGEVFLEDKSDVKLI